MSIKFYADAVAFLHNIICLFLIVGFFVAIRNHNFNRFYCTASGITILCNALYKWNCPLSIWEKELRELSGERDHNQTFILGKFESWVGIDFPGKTALVLIILTYTITFFLLWKRKGPKPST